MFSCSLWRKKNGSECDETTAEEQKRLLACRSLPVTGTAASTSSCLSTASLVCCLIFASILSSMFTFHIKSTYQPYHFNYSFVPQRNLNSTYINHTLSVFPQQELVLNQAVDPTSETWLELIRGPSITAGCPPPLCSSMLVKEHPSVLCEEFDWLRGTWWSPGLSLLTG